MASYARQVRNDNLYMVCGGSDDTGQPTWYFVQVESAKVKAFLRGISAGDIHLEQFGEIIESGYGAEPPPAIVAWMKKHYGFAA